MIQRITVGAFAVVALVAAAISYDHVSHLAGDVWWAWLLPFSIDGLLVAGSLALWIERQTGRASALSVTSVVLGLLWSLGANLASTNPDLIPRAVIDPLLAVWPPIALGLAFELLIRIRRSSSDSGQADTDDRDEPPAVPDRPAVQPGPAADTPRPAVREQRATVADLSTAQDDEVVRDLREWANMLGRTPSGNEVRQRYSCGHRRATRLLNAATGDGAGNRADQAGDDEADRAGARSRIGADRAGFVEEGALTS